MRVVGFGLTKVEAEKLSASFSSFGIETSINLESVDQNEILPKKEGNLYLDISFKYTIEYTKKIAKIALSGKIVLLVEEKAGEEILKNWKKKDLKEELKLGIFNSILMKSNLKALQIEEDIGLPPHFKLPTLTLSKKE